MQSIETLLEAVLFSSGRPVSASDMAEGLSKELIEVEAALEKLQQTIRRRRGGALQISEVAGKWSLEVKPVIAEEVRNLARAEISEHHLSTAALIAYHQPLAQSKLVEMIGPKAYDHVKVLAELGLVERRRKGNTRTLGTTPRFSEYFGCPYSDRKRVKKWFREKAGSLGMTNRLDSLDGYDAGEEE